MHRIYPFNSLFVIALLTGMTSVVCTAADTDAAQPRKIRLRPEDPGALAWLKLAQDTGSPERQLLPSILQGDEGQTFNNALAAMAFILHDERERAERILDFFAQAAEDRNNTDPTLQSFYLRGEARGFYQHISMHGSDSTPRYHAPPETDRWMGDMVWLLLAYQHHQQTYKSDKYAEVMTAITDLLLKYYTKDPDGHGGYVRHGWRKGDVRLHEDHGHHEGNIDCYALFRVLGRDDLADQIAIWLSHELDARQDLPLDLYAWRVLAMPERGELLKVPENDPRYRKTVRGPRGMVTGFFHGPVDVENLWLDGLGHMSCAYRAAGDDAHANYYANQLARALVPETLDGQKVKGIPYTINQNGGYEWVNPKAGFASATAWYIFAEQGFNPLRLESKREAK